MKFAWDVICECAFNNLKKQFMTVLIFAHFNLNFKCVLKADLFDHTQEDVLSQYDKNDVLYSVVYFSWKLNVTELNYEIYNKKLLMIIQYFKQWWFKFEKSAFLMKMLTECKL